MSLFDIYIKESTDVIQDKSKADQSFKFYHRFSRKAIIKYYASWRFLMLKGTKCNKYSRFSDTIGDFIASNTPYKLQRLTSLSYKHHFIFKHLFPYLSVVLGEGHAPGGHITRTLGADQNHILFGLKIHIFIKVWHTIIN